MSIIYYILDLLSREKLYSITFDEKQEYILYGYSNRSSKNDKTPDITIKDYRYDSINKIFATFDDEKSIVLKVKYAKENNLGGIMFWQLMNDKKEDGLLKTMVNEMKGY